MTALWAIVAGIRLLAELGGLVAAVIVTSRLVEGPSGWILGGAVALIIAMVWARWIGPRSGRRLPDPPRMLLEVGIFVALAGALIETGAPVWGLALLVAEIATAVSARRAPFPM